MHLGFEIKALLVKKNIKQKDLALRMGIANCRVNQYMNGWLTFPEKLAKKMCRLINIDYNAFAKGQVKDLEE